MDCDSFTDFDELSVSTHEGGCDVQDALDSLIVSFVIVASLGWIALFVTWIREGRGRAQTALKTQDTPKVVARKWSAKRRADAENDHDSPRTISH